MKGHVTKKGTNWYFVLDIGIHPTTGKRKQKWFSGFKTKKEAEKAMIKKLNEVNDGTYMEPQKITLGNYLLKWLQDFAKVNTAPLTYEGYSYIVKSHILPSGIGSIKLDKLKPVDIQHYYAEKLQNGRKDGTGGLSSKSVYSHHRLLHESLEHAVKWRIIPNNPVKATIPPKPQKKRMNTLSKEHIHTLLNEAKKTDISGPIYLAINTGMRRGEILGLRWIDVDFTSGILRVLQTIQRVNNRGIIIKDSPKTDGGARTIAISESVVSYLKQVKADYKKNKSLLGDCYQDYGLVFARPDGSPLDPDTFSRSFKKLVNNLDIPTVRFHDLRHSHATLLLQQGEHPKIVSERLGHSTIGITMDTYSHVTPNMQKEAAKKFDSFLFGSSC